MIMTNKDHCSLMGYKWYATYKGKAILSNFHIIWHFMKFMNMLKTDKYDLNWLLFKTSEAIKYKNDKKVSLSTILVKTH